MLSESQERMLIILNSGKEENAKNIFSKWGLDFSVIGKTTNTKNLVLNFDGKEVANLPLNSLSDNAPVYNRKWKKTSTPSKIKRKIDFKKIKILESLKTILKSPNNSEKSWVWEQYDHTVMGDTVQKPGGDSAVVRIHGKNKGIAMTIDSSTRYCLSNPILGGKQIVSESWRNLVAVGSTPIAITNCLNFGNPEKQEIMGQFVETIDGVSQACSYLDYPVVSGNVSFYNETKNKAISPTPTIGGIGLINNLDNMTNYKFKKNESLILVIGKTLGHLDQSEFFYEVMKIFDGPPPEVNLFNEKNNGVAVQRLISDKLVNSVHDISAGGILTTLTEMCISGGIGAKIKIPQNNINVFEYLFGEDQSRYIVEIEKKNKKKVTEFLEKSNIYYDIIGETQIDNIELNKDFKIPINELKKDNSSWFKNYYKDN